MIDVVEKPARGTGRIRISASLWPDLGKPETPEEWHKALLLPESYEVVSTEAGQYNLIEVMVKHEDIPIVEDITSIEVVPRYGALYNEKTGQRLRAGLDRIDILQWDGEHWDLMKVPNSGGDTDDRKREK